MKKRALVFMGIAGATIAKGAVYIAPADIDTYKQKTDQTFYDMYQNPNSPIAKGANPALKNLFANIKTGDKLAYGSTIGKVVQGNVQGTPIKPGTVAHGYIEGIGTLTFEVDDQGNVRVYGPYTNSSHTQAVREGSNAIPLSGVRCAATRQINFGKMSATECTEYERSALEEVFDITTGTLTQRYVTERAPGICSEHRTSWYSGYVTCHPGNFGIAVVNNVITHSYDIANILKNNQQLVAKYAPIANSGGRNVVYRGSFADRGVMRRGRGGEG